MAAHKISDEHAEETLRRIEAELMEGHAPPWAGGGGAISAAARRAVQDGFVATQRTFRSRYDAARRLREVDWTLYRAPVYTRANHATIIDPVRIMEAAKPTGRQVKVCVIGDLHDDPRLEDKSRFLWIGRWIAEQAPDYIVQIGDWGTFDSMSTHQERGSTEERFLPSWTQDIESFYESIATMEKGIQSRDVKRMVTEGNHETRVSRYENKNPNLGNTLSGQWKGALREHGWNIRPFGEYYFIERVGFVHHMINGVGKAFGGKTGNQRAGNDLTFSVFHGHDHKREIVSLAKIGPTPEVSVVSVGCGLPWGWVEDYAKLSMTGWWWGVTSTTIQDGVITGLNFTSMLELEASFSDKKKRSPLKAKV